MVMAAPLVLLAASLTVASVSGEVSGLCEPQAVEEIRRVLVSQSEGLSSEPLRHALEAYRRAACQKQARKPVLAVIDYSLPSEK
jgi:hypothetical protein